MTLTNGVKANDSTIIVDLGGIFLHAPSDHRLPAGDSTVPLRRIMTSLAWLEYEAGKLSEEEAFDQLAQQHGFQPNDLSALINHLRENVQYDRDTLAIFQKIKQIPGVLIVLASNISEPDFQALGRRWDDSFWKTFDHVFTSSMLGIRKPSLRFYRHVLREARAVPHKTYVVDDQPENTLATLSLGMHGVTGTDHLSRRLANFLGDPVSRGWAFLRQLAGNYITTTQDGFGIEENYAPLLVLEVTKDWSLVDFKRPPGMWNFFSGPPKFTSREYPDDLDTTSLALAAMEYDADTANPILDEMLNYIDEDGAIQAYVDRSRPRVDAVIALNVLTVFHMYDRGHELPETTEWITNILLTRAYIHGTRYYSCAEWFLYYVARLLERSNDAALHERFTEPLKKRVIERIGSSGDAFVLSTRLLACQYLGIENDVDKERLRDMQSEDGGWNASCMYYFPGQKKEVGNRGVVTAFSVKALGG